MKTLKYKGKTYEIKNLGSRVCVYCCTLTFACREVRLKTNFSLCATEFSGKVKFYEYLDNTPIQELFLALKEDNKK